MISYDPTFNEFGIFHESFNSTEGEIALGCLSYPEMLLNIKRPFAVIVKYEDEEKNIHKVKLSGFPARVFLHEYDHMEGIDFTQRTDG